MRYQTDIVRRTHTEDIVTFCQNIDDPALRSGCFHGLGRSIALEVYDGTRSIDTCHAAELEPARISCVEAIAEVLHEYDHTVARAACDELAAYPELSARCHAALEVGLYSFEKDFSPYIGATVTRP